MPEYRIKPGGMHDFFMKSRKKLQVIGGGFGNGKTAASCIKAIQLAKDYPGCNGFVGMATYAQLNDTIRKEFYKWLPKSSVDRWPTISDNTLRLKNGSVVNFRYLKQKGKAAAQDGNTSSNLLSATYDWAVVDQIENPEITYKDYLDLWGRLRGTTPYKGDDETMPETGPRWMILTANPSFNWVYHKLIKPWNIYKNTGEIVPELSVDEDGIPIMEIFEAATYENKHNLPADFINTLESVYKGQFRDRYLGGEWGAFEGLVYPMFNAETHMIPRSRIMQYIYSLGYKRCKPILISGYDFGLTSPSCFLMAFVDHRGRVFVIDGFYARDMSLPLAGQKMSAMLMQYYPFAEDIKAIEADPAIYKRTIVNGMGGGADTVKNILSSNYNLNFRPGQNDIAAGIAKVGAYLSVDTFPHFETNEPNGHLIYFASELSFIADEFGSYFWEMHKDERVDKPIDKNDHAMDTLKYMFSNLPQASELMFNYSTVFGANEGWMKPLTLPQ